MSIVRQDAWSVEDDLILAEVTLRHIREGSTQLLAFEEVGERIGRTAAACGFRWNSLVRKKYESAIQIAKAQRQQRTHIKRSPTNMMAQPVAELVPIESSEQGEHSSNIDSIDSIDQMIRFLKSWKGNYQEMGKRIRILERSLQESEREANELRAKNERLLQDMNHVQSDYQVVNDDYRALIQIMDRARKMAFLIDDQQEKTKFKMDANGNLERLE